MDKKQIAIQVREARIARGWSQEALADLSGTSQSTIDRIEKGDFKRRPSQLPDVLGALGFGPTVASVGNTTLTTRKNNLVGDRNLPVFASAEAGNGALILSSDPVDHVRRPAPLSEVKDGYGLIVLLSSMEPEFRPGDTVLVHPHLPPVRGEACVIYADDGAGTVKAVVKSFVRATESHWYVQQWNPKRQIKLSRKEWQKCHRIVGKYSAR